MENFKKLAMLLRKLHTQGKIGDGKIFITSIDEAIKDSEQKLVMKLFSIFHV